MHTARTETYNIQCNEHLYVKMYISYMYKHNSPTSSDFDTKAGVKCWLTAVKNLPYKHTQ
jgi:hypothetical protein